MIILANFYLCGHLWRHSLFGQIRGTRQLNVSKYLGIVSKGFLNALGACLVNLELP